MGAPRRWLRVSAAVVGLPALLVGVLAGAGGASASQNPPAPGLPLWYLGQNWSPEGPLTRATLSQNGFSLGEIAATRAEITKVKSVIDLPKAVLALNTVSQQVFEGTGRNRTQRYFNFPTEVYVQSPDAESPDWGLLPETTTTSLAFGFVPVTVTTRLEQLRDADGLPVPFHAKVDSRYGNNGTGQELFDTEFTGQLTLTVTKVLLDGQPLDIGSSCRTREPATLALIGKPPEGFTREAGAYYPPYGGDLYGTLDIPPFAGCVGASGDDLSALFTNALSADGNPVATSLGYPGQNIDPDRYGGTPGVGCVPGPAAICQDPPAMPPITGLGQVPTQPPNWTPKPSPIEDYPYLEGCKQGCPTAPPGG